MKRTLLSLLFLIYLIPSHAQEGMWLLSQINQLKLSEKGLKIPVAEIYSPGKTTISDAIVQLDGGTASFVSKDGLLLTNHHVAYAAIQRTSTVNNDYLESGFLATRRTDELRAPGYEARLLIDMKDVTTEVLDTIKGINDPAEKSKRVNAKIMKMTSAVKNGKDDTEAGIAQMYNGRQYVLFIHKVFRDIRIVYAPPSSIGNYGGETDNWMWPRHTGDFSFMRVYCAPDGSGSEYSASNVPYHPKIWLKVAKDFLKDGDFNFIIGYPGMTTRYRSSTSVYWNEHNNYPFAIKNFREIIDLFDQLTKNDHQSELKVASLKKGLANVIKNYQGKLDGMRRTHYYEKKLAFEKEFVDWANSKPATKAKYAGILAREKEEYKALDATKDRDQVFSVFQGFAGTPLAVAEQIVSTAQKREKSDPDFSENTVNQIIEGLPDTYANYWEPVDKAMLVRALTMAEPLPPNQRITALNEILNNDFKSLKQIVDEAYQSSKLTDPAYAATLYRKPVKELKDLKDPFIDLAFRLDPMAQEIEAVNKKFSDNVTDLRKTYIDGLYEWKGAAMYPDANGTKRFTWGKVKGYKPADAVWYYPFTTLGGVIEKNTGEDPFNCPVALTELYKNRDLGKWMNPAMKDIPVAWLNQCDITGGNSGSPVMNDKGEICGIAFDGNYEAMISDWQYDPNLQRTISVDIHYVMFITEKVGKAGFLLDEMKGQ